MNTQITNRIQNIVNDCFMRGLGFVPAHRIVYRTIGRGTAGLAVYHNNTLIFDPFFIENNLESYLARTVPHEVAHLICKLRYPNAKQGHGPEWRSIMNLLGAEETRCHSYSIVNAPGTHARNHKYTCACAGRVFSLTTRLHNAIEKGNTRRCRACSTTLVFKETSQ